MFKYLIYSFFLFGFMMLHAQNSGRIKQTLGLAYLGERIVNPGLQANYKYCFPLSKSNFHHNLEIGGSVSGYIHPQNYVGLLLAPSLAYRYLASKGWNLGLTTDYGVFQRFYHGKVYTLDGAGNVASTSLVGQSRFSYGNYLSLGKNFHKNEIPTWGLFCDLGFLREINAVAGKGITHLIFVFGIKKNFTYEK